MTSLLVGDGGLGSELRLRGVRVPSHVESIWSAQALFAAPEEIVTIHRDYIKAGAQYITINNYAVTRPILARANLASEIERYTQQAVALGQRAIGDRRGVQLAASLPPLQTSYRPDLMLPEQECLKQYTELVRMLAPQVDILICETMSSALEARCALQAARQEAPEAVVWVSWTLHGTQENRLPSGETLEEAFIELGDYRPDAFLINCCAANVLTEGLRTLRGLTQLPIGGYGNAENVKLTSTREPDMHAEEAQKVNRVALNETEYLAAVKAWISMGASIVGGCCRVRPAYIKAISEHCQALNNKRSTHANHSPLSTV